MPGLRMPTAIVLATIVPLMVSPTMSQTKCNPVKVAYEYLYLKESGPTDLSFRHPAISETDTVWTVRYELPPDWPGFGFNHVIDIDKRTCAVVRVDKE